ncbi:hypothetical protein L2E82_36487 [Cichorium intybus]|uniref:Uncharacterized protein n=1 Tax=Cichorium intybus TaxID=13427 RepID=A0ACB9BRP0_CICIN|nr:hypothetical protein L2E82_36487 [Cichorium intybus]
MGKRGKKRPNRPRGEAGGGSGQGSNQIHSTPPETTLLPAAPLPAPYEEASSGGTAAVAMDSAVLRQTVKIEKDQEDLDHKYLVGFTIDAYVDGRIVVYFSSTRRGDSNEVLTTENLIPSIPVDLEAVSGEFKQISGKGIDLSSYNATNASDTYWLVIHAVPSASISEGGSSDLEVTIAVFEKEDDEFQIRVICQFVRVNGVRYVLYDTDDDEDDADSFRNDQGVKCVGKLFIFTTKIVKCSNESDVFEGSYEDRDVAVKIVPKKPPHYKEIEVIKQLIESDQWANIVKCYGVKEDLHYVYIILQRWVCSLHDLITTRANPGVRPLPTMEVFKNFHLWKVIKRKQGNYWNPTPLLLELMRWNTPRIYLNSSYLLGNINCRDIVAGLAYLHKKGIIHGDLKPEDIVLIHKDTSFSAKLSNVGISKKILLLAADQSSLSITTTAIGNFGSQAPELLQNERLDLFSLGCVLYFCITRGKHLFGDGKYQQDTNIENNDKDLAEVNDSPEAKDIISLLYTGRISRPTAAEVYNHPLFWDPETRLSFIRAASDLMQSKVHGPHLYGSLENLTHYENWRNDVNIELINDIIEYHGYEIDYNVKTLLRTIRNYYNHYDTISDVLQKKLGKVPIEFNEYFRSRFPKLLMEVYTAFKKYCVKKKLIGKYYKSGCF